MPSINKCVALGCNTDKSSKIIIFGIPKLVPENWRKILSVSEINSKTKVQLRTKVLSRQMSCRNLRNTLRFLFTVLVLVVVQTSKSTQINRLGTQIPKM